MTNRQPSILIVEDEGIVAEDIRASLAGLGYDIVGAVATGEEAVELAGRTSPDLILMDIMLAGPMNGIEAATTIRNRWGIPVIFLTAFPDSRLIDQARDAGSHGYLMKPFRDRELQASIEIGLLKHRLETGLRKAKEEWERTFDVVPDLIAITDANRRITRCNLALASRLGLPKDQVVGRLCHEIFHKTPTPPPLCPCDQLHGDSLEHVGELVEPHLGGHFLFSVTPLRDDSGGFAGAVHVARDINPVKRMEEQQRRIDEQAYRDQKDRSLITIAGGIAHEFNNILTIVMGNAELLRMRIRGDERAGELIADIESAGARMATLTSHLLAYAKGGKYQPRRISIIPYLNAALDLTLKGEKRQNIEIVTELSPDLCEIVADPDQLTQMLTNVFSNAVEAMPAGGRLTVKAATVSRETVWESSMGGIHPAGEYAWIAISDTGAGIPRKHLRDVFEPFFTTKFTGRGLGLSAVLGIVLNHGGCVDLKSEEGKGTTVEFFIPRAPVLKTPAAKGSAGKVSSGLVLVVDDEPKVRDLLRRLLERFGYNVLVAPGGIEALQLFRENASRLCLVILDIMMPDMRGSEVFRQIKDMMPGIPVLISSGFDREVALSNMILEPADDFLQKPYTSKDLMNAVTRLIADANSG